MSIWLCPNHGLTGGNICCAKAAIATLGGSWNQDVAWEHWRDTTATRGQIATALDDTDLRDWRQVYGFVRESNRIEGITATPHVSEIRALNNVLAAPVLTVELLRDYVWTIARAPLRDKPGLDVRVGRHLPPRGGPEIRDELTSLLCDICEHRSASGETPFSTHLRYETLHPFMDGNGRSGRAVWLWMMGGIENAPLGFLHTFYYQSLEAGQRGSVAGTAGEVPASDGQ